MPYLSIVVLTLTHSYLPLNSFHFVSEGGEIIMPLLFTCAFFAVMVQIASPAVTRAICDGNAFVVDALCDSRVRFWRVFGLFRGFARFNSFRQSGYVRVREEIG